MTKREGEFSQIVFDVLSLDDSKIFEKGKVFSLSEKEKNRKLIILALGVFQERANDLALEAEDLAERIGKFEEALVEQLWEAEDETN
jgi:hypothetical protein